MRRKMLWLVPMLGSLSLSCGGTGSTAGTGGSGGREATASTTGSQTTTTGTQTTTSNTTGAGGAMAGGVPDPGTSNQVDQVFTNVEPNDSPEKATPLGIAMTGNVNVWVDSNMIGGGGDAADYFVFKSGPMAGTFTCNICFMPPITAMTATLWKVVGAKAETPPLGTWMSSGTCVATPMGGAPLEASTTYLLGLTSTGGAGTYAA